MSKRELKEYLRQLTNEQLQEQIIDLYAKFKDVKEFYDFAFKPQENKLLEEAKFKISKEYFPVNGRKAKIRRSVAQNYIRHFKRLGVESSLIADLMLYHIEIAQTYSSDKEIKQESFYKSMYKAFTEARDFIERMGMLRDFRARLLRISEEAENQSWKNGFLFKKTIELLSIKAVKKI